MRLLLLLCLPLFLTAQKTLTLSPSGFESINIERPKYPADRIIDQIRIWAGEYHRTSEKAYEVYEVTTNSLKIDGYRDNFFFYRNKGETYQHQVKYTIAITIEDNVIRWKLSIGSIFANGNASTLTVAKLFNGDGKLKQDYPEAKASMEKSANDMLDSFVENLSYLR